MTTYRAHKVTQTLRDNGEILLSSGYPMSRPAHSTWDWMNRWEQEAPDRVFLSERSGEGWREITYAAAAEQARAIAGGLLDSGLDGSRSIMILSGNGIDHAVLSMAAHLIGVPTVPVAEQYSLIPAAQVQLNHIVETVNPAMVFAVDGEAFGSALGLDLFRDIPKVVARVPGPGMRRLEDLAIGGDVSGAASKVGPDTVAKYLMTSGSTSLPKAVITTQGMLTANQVQVQDCLPFVTERPPVLVDWLPWNHTFGGSYNFNLVLANGGTMHIDDGKPAPHLVARSIENLRQRQGTIAFNVPIGYSQLLTAMQTDTELRDSYFRDLDMLFYAGSSLPADMWTGLEEMARLATGRVPLMNTSWGMTETAPGALLQYQRSDNPANVGVPMTGTDIRLISAEDGRFDLRVRGPQITPGYLNAPEKTAESFDDEGYFISGDLVRMVDADRPELGLSFSGRMTEEFKLLSGTWVRGANLRLKVLGHLAPLAADVVVTGENRKDVGLLIVPNPAKVGAFEATDHDGLLHSPALEEAIRDRVTAHNQNASGSASRIARVAILAEPPSMPEGEMTAKGNINFRKLLDRRADLVSRLFDDAEQSAIRFE